MIEPGTHLTPPVVQEAIVEALDRIERGSTYLGGLLNDLADRKGTHDITYARALLASAQTSKERREAEALLAVEVTFREQLKMEAQVKAARERLTDLRLRVEALRSLSALMRDSFFPDSAERARR